MATYRLVVNGKELDVKLLSRCGPELHFSIDDKAYRVEVRECLELSESARSGVIKGAALSVRGRSDGAVLAPMPGIVVSIPVSTGQSVKLGDTVAVIEAMKMENNIRAPQDGTVQNIHVKVGQEVNNAAVLMTIIG